MEKKSFSDYIVYVDESGDHGLESIDPNYPLFVLSFCIFHKNDYATIVSPKIQSFKFKYFGYDTIVLHEHEIRKSKNNFGILFDKELRESFLKDLNSAIEESPFTIIASAIKKEKLREKYSEPNNPYHIALGFGLERIYYYLKQLNQVEQLTHIVFERRGKKEDDDLELEFRRVCDGNNFIKMVLPFKIIFADKKVNSGGLQLADLTARPIGLSLLRPNQKNHAYEIIENKFYKNSQGNKDGAGLKCFP